MTDLTLDTRIRDAELSVRTANLLCKAFGENVSFRSFVDPSRPIAEMIALIGRKGFNEFKEVLGYAIEGSRLAAMLRKDSTKTLRDEFAMAALTGLLAGNFVWPNATEGIDFDQVASDAIGYADAMMEARSK